MAMTLGSLIGRLLRPRGRGRFVRDDSGATAIEFGILAVPFFAIIGAILETSVVFLSSQLLESAVLDTSRYIRTGEAQDTIVTAANFKTQVCGRLYGLFGDCSGLHVEVQTLNDFSSINITAPVDWTCKNLCGWTRNETYAPGQGSSIVVVQVYYKWPILLSLGGLDLANLADQKRLLSASTVFRSEPFT